MKQESIKTITQDNRPIVLGVDLDKRILLSLNGPASYLDIETLSYIKKLAEESIETIKSKNIDVENLNNAIFDDYYNNTLSISKKEKIKDERYLYIMKDISNGYHKIGISKNPLHRERTLQSEKPTIELVWVSDEISSKARTIEKALHSYFEHRHIRGEWYNLSSHQIESIKNNYSKWTD